MSSQTSNEAAFLRHGATMAAVFLISLTLLLSELLLTRVFSVLFMSHLAFLVISLALFGLGVGGIAVYLFPDWFAGHLQRRLVTLAMCFSATLVLLVLFLFNLPFSVASGFRATLSLVAVYLMASTPFFVGGTCLSVLLSRAGQQVNRLYFVDLLGAGAGCLLIIPALNYLGGVTALLTASVTAAAAALMFAWPETGGTAAQPNSGRLLQRVLLLIAISLGVGCVVVLLAEPVAAWLGNRLFRAHEVYSNRQHPFQHYFDTLIAPEIHHIVSTLRIPLLLGFLVAGGGYLYVRNLCATATGQAGLARSELRLAAGVLLVTLVGLVGLNAASDAIRIRFAKGRVEFGNLFEGWNSFSRIAVLPRRGKNPHAYAWGLSPLYKGPAGEQLALDIDSLAGTPLVKFDGNFDAPGLEHLRHDITALAYSLRPARKTLIIGPGGGRDVLTALVFGSKDVTAVELNPIMQKVVNEKFGDFTGRLYQRPEINFNIDDGRHFVSRTEKRFGVIQLSLVDTWASTAAGAFALSENSLYTQEAFEDYLSKLEPDGVVTISRWLEDPPRETLRVVSLARAALARFGINDIRNHVIVAGTPLLRRRHAFASVVVSLQPFSGEEIAKAKEFTDRLGFDVLYMPGNPKDPLFSEFITTNDTEGFFRRYDLDVSPTSDDRPFFFNSTKPKDFFRFWEEKPGRMGVQLLARLIGIVTTLVALFIFVPLYARRRSALAVLEPRERWSTLLYFGALGSGFMMIEVGLVSKFVLFLGHPIYALTVVLCTLLISAGLGSYWSGRNVGPGHDSLRKVIAMALVSIVVLALVVEVVFGHLLADASLTTAAILSIVTLAPVGFLMGMPFPLGLRLLDSMGSQWAQLVPWVWGINGSTSVLGSVLAISIAINLGFRATLLGGLCIYAVAYFTAGYIAGGERASQRVAKPAKGGAARARA